MTRLIDADALKIALYYDVSKGTYGEFMDGSEVSYTNKEILQLIDAQPTIDAISISFIEEQVKLCNEIGFSRGEECFTALIEKWREENGTETD